jgi:hypothetical protein
MGILVLFLLTLMSCVGPTGQQRDLHESLMEDRTQAILIIEEARERYRAGYLTEAEWQSGLEAYRHFAKAQAAYADALQSRHGLSLAQEAQLVARARLFRWARAQGIRLGEHRW